MSTLDIDSHGSSHPDVARIRRAELTPVDLDPRHGVVRTPARPYWSRIPGFEEQFEFFTLFYDVFWGHRHDTVVALGPPPLYRDGRLVLPTFYALPSGARCHGLLYTSRLYSTFSWITLEVPRGTQALRIELGDQIWEQAIQPNVSASLSGCRALVTLSRNNDLDWIADWATYHVRKFHVDTVVIYDNGSTAYVPEDVQLVLRSVAGLKDGIVISQPKSWGAEIPYWRDTVFLQVAMLNHARQRFLADAEIIMNLDIDELLLDRGRHLDAFMVSDVAAIEVSRRNLCIAPSRTVQDSPRHADFWAFPEPDQYVGGKWLIKPRQLPEDVTLEVHHVLGYEAAKAPIKELEVAHFLGLNTRWKSAEQAHVWSGPPVKTPSTTPRGCHEDLWLKQTVGQSLEEPTAIDPWTPLESRLPEQVFLEAARLWAAGDAANALSALEHCLGVAPDYVAALALLAEVATAQGNEALAETARTREEDLTVFDPTWAYEAARTHCLVTEATDANSYITRFVDPDTDEHRTCLAILAKPLEKERASYPQLELLGDLLWRSGNLETAEWCYREALGLLPPEDAQASGAMRRLSELMSSSPGE